MFKLILVFFAVVVSWQSHAIAVSSLFEVADEESHLADVEIVNNDGRNMFINLEMSKVHYVNGEKVEEQLSKANLSDWRFKVSPAQMILRKDERKSFRMFYDCKDDCQIKEDQIYAVSVTPVPYSEGETSAVAIAFGYKVYFIQPATVLDIDYDLKRISSDKFSFENRSNTMLNAVLNICTKEFSSDCIYQHRLLPGAKKEFLLPVNVQQETNLEFSVINANEVFHETIIL